MTDVFILDWWFRKHKKQIVEFVQVAIELEQLTPEELAIRKKELILEFIDSCESNIIVILCRDSNGTKDILEEIHKRIFKEELNG